LNLLLKLGLVILAGLIGGKIARHFKLPDVTGYLIAGLFLGGSFLQLVSEQDIDSLGIISELALAVIAFSIGSEFVVKEMKKLGKAVFIITLAEVIGAVIVVFTVVYYIFQQSFVFSIIIASMSAATAPAATLMVIRQFRARGPLTQTILPVVALDDVFGIIAFGLAVSVAKIVTGGSDQPLALMVTKPFIEIFASLLLGCVFGVILTYACKFAPDNEVLLGLILAVIGITTGIANWLGLSALLACIMVGTMVVNLKHNPNRVFSSLNNFTPPLYLLFFTLAGASLDLRILASVGFLGVGYILARMGGKMAGAWAGAKISASPDVIRKYLGLALLPQGGISIGLTVIVRQMFPEQAEAIATIIMFSVLVYETTGPIFAKIAIQKAGEVGGMDRKPDHTPEAVALK